MALLLSKYKRNRDTVVALLVVVSIVLVGLLIGLDRRAQALSLQVSASYNKALYESAELLKGMQLGLEKLQVSTSSARRQALLNDIVRQADGARDNLSMLPTGEAALSGALKYVNQVGDYARVLAERLSNGGALSVEDRTQIAELLKSAVALNDQLNDMVDRLERGEFAFEVNTSVLNALPQTPENEVEPLVQFPTLLYDGPFSDARDTGTIKVGGAPIDADEAGQRLSAFIGDQRVRSIVQTGESELLEECYDFDVVTESGTLSASVTRHGGHVVYMLPNEPIEDARLTIDECIDLGVQFLRDRGYGEMAPSYWQQQDAVLTANYAAVQDGVILYPDLVKLQINMGNGLVVGVESVNYLRNHTWRVLPAPTVTEEMAMASLSEAVAVEQIRRCVIPLEVGEAQCWEITVRYEGGNYYLIYVDVFSGREQSILQLVSGNGGLTTA